MLPTEIAPIVDRVLRIVKKGTFSTKSEKEEFYSGYNQMVEAMNEIRVHTVRGVYPDKLIASRAPNMTEMEQKYVAANYKQVTLPVYVDYINTIKRAFSDNNWSIEYPDDEGNEGSFRHYVEQGMIATKMRMNLEGYIKNIVPALCTVDAMGCVAMKPEKIKTEIIDDQMVIASELLDPISQYYSCDQIKAFLEGEWYLFLTNEHSDVTVGDRVENTGFVYEFYDRNAIYKIIQIGAKKDNKYQIDLYYQHDKNQVAVRRLEGIPEYKDGDMWWLSPFSYVTPMLDDALIDSNMIRGVKATSMFPYRVMVGNTCEHKLELNGEVKCCDGRGYFDDFERNTIVKCPGCGGSGLKDRISPQGVMLIRPETPSDQGELKATQPSMYFVSPPVDVPQFIRTEIEKAITAARKILHVRESSTEVVGSEDLTATGMVIDEKALYSFIKPISDQIFTIYRFILDWTGIIRYGDIQKYVLIEPITFDFKTEYDYLMEISIAIKNGLPPFVVHTIVIKYLRTMFYNQLESAAAFNLITRTDRLITMDDDEVTIKLSKGLIAPWEVILHDSAVTFIMELLMDDPKFFDKEEQVQIDALIAKATEKASETKVSIPTSPSNLVNDILNGIGS